MGKLEGKSTIITGAAQGLGAAIAAAFVAEGAKVVLADVLEDKGQETAQALGPKATFAKLDVSHPEDWKRVVDDTIAREGTIDALVNNAGILMFGSVAKADTEAVRRLFNVNFFGSLNGLQAVLPHMKKAKNGSVVNICSSDSISVATYVGIYCSSKFALRALTKAAALENIKHNIRINAVHPGGLNTPMTNPEQLPQEELMSMGFDAIPIKRPGQPEEVTPLVVFLASDENTLCCGGDFVVDGGVSAGHSYGLENM